MNFMTWTRDQSPFVINKGQAISKADFYGDVIKVSYFIDQLSSPAIAIKFTDSYSTLVVMFACYCCGKLAVPLNPKFSEAEEQALLANLDRPYHMLRNPMKNQFSALDLNEKLSSHGLGEVFSSLASLDLGRFNEALKVLIMANGAETKDSFKGQENKEWMVIFTSGSSGSPKGVVHSFKTLQEAARSSIDHYQMKAGEVSLLSLGLHHIGGLMIALRAVLSDGLIVMDDAQHALTKSAATKIDYISLVPTQLQGLLEDAELHPASKKCKAILLGGASCPSWALLRAFDLGLKISLCYGSSETGAQILATDPGRVIFDPRLVGKAMPGRSLSLKDTELTLRGAGCYLGYMTQGRFEASHGIYEAPDQFECHEGDYFFCGRQDLVFQCGGENIAPTTMEMVLQTFPWPASYRVIPRPDKKFGAVPILIASMESPFDLKDFLSFIKEHFNPLTRPRAIYWDRSGFLNEKIGQKAALDLVLNGRLDELWRYQKNSTS